MKHRLGLTRRPRPRLVLLAALAAILLTVTPLFAGIATTKHNLSVSGPGTTKAVAETQTCVFCHAPHNTSPAAPLWNRSNPGGNYTPYSSSTSLSHPGQPTGASLICLSCHDGTIALGDVLSRGSRIGMAAGVTTMPAGNSNLGTDLSNDHPVSFAYTSNLATARGELANPATLTGRVKLDASGQLQCTSCHDPHDDSNGKFLVVPNQASALCQTCHLKNYWGASDHKLSAKTWNGAGTNPWPHTNLTTVAANACENCHRPHLAGGKEGLQNYAAEENNCYTCHNGNVAAKNIQSEFTSKISIHPVATNTGVHSLAESAVVQTRHVECADCHNPHAVNAATGTLSGSLAGVRGVNSGGNEVKPATFEYQICFRCHADSSGQPAPRTARKIVQSNTRLEFATTNPSFHPIEGPGKSTKVPSLIAPLTTASTIKCSDCHNNNAGPGAGGTGPAGPHGSTNPALLERPYATGAPTAGDICYKCHSQSVVTREPPHNRTEHLRYGCKACHDPHGISSTQGTAQYNSRLINLSTTDNKPVGTGAAAKLYVDTVARTCYLNCHGESHSGRSY